MQSYWIQMTEAGSRLELREGPVPQPGPGQLLVRMRAASLNRGEFLAAHGAGAAASPWKPAGSECAGEVAALGEGVTGFAIGQRVMGRSPGSFAEFVVMEAAETMPVPAGLPWEEAACIPLAFLVAFDMLVLQGRLKAGEWVLINGVSSGVGVASLQLAKALGAQVIGTSGAQGKLDRLRPLGLDLGLCTRAPDFAAAVREATGQHGADLVINTVGGSVFAENVRCMAFEGRLATVGYVDGQLHADLDIEALHAKRLTLFGVSNKLRSKAQRAAALPRFIAEVLPHVAARRVVAQIDQVVDFNQLPAAKARMEAGEHVGKIVVRGVG